MISNIAEFARSIGRHPETTRKELLRGYCNLRVQDGRTRHPLFKTYDGMVDRCYRDTNTSYKYYGAAGIKICGRWFDYRHGFWNFVEDMGERPEGMTLDRIDNDGDYTPENCRWATLTEQLRNRSCMVTNKSGIRGVTKNKDKWIANAHRNNKTWYLGTFVDKEKAKKAVQDWRILECAVERWVVDART